MRFKTFLIERRILSGYHSTTKVAAADIIKNGFHTESSELRLIPKSISFSPSVNYHGGDVVLRGTFEVDETDVLRLKIGKRGSGENFWDFADSDDDTPATVGKRWYKKAMTTGMKMLVISGVPGIGVEYVVLDRSIIKNVTFV